MGKLLLFADLHIHPHKRSTERLKNCIDVLHWVFETAEKNNANHILFLGDLFHDRQKIDVPTYQWTFEAFEKHLYGSFTKVYLLLGNHDLYYHLKYDTSSVKPLGSIENVTVISKPCTLHFPNKDVSFLPYTNNPIEDLKILEKENDDGILMGHLAVDGATLNFNAHTKAEVAIEHDGDMVHIGADLFDNWNQVFLGHYHGAQHLSGTVEYIGSPLQLSFGEAFEKKHIIIYDLDNNTKQYIENDFSPKHYIIPVSDLDKYDLANNFVSLIVNDLSSSEVVDIKQDLSTKNLGSLDLRQKPKEEQDQIVIDQARTALFRDANIVERFVDNTQELWKGLDRDKLIAVGKKIMAKRGTND
jgi:DNA repair exonuclease SbcCD nuclease subunit